MNENEKRTARGEFPSLSFWVMALGMSVVPSVNAEHQVKTDTDELTDADDERADFSPDEYLKRAAE